MPAVARLVLAAVAGLALALGQVPWSLWPVALIGLGVILHLVAGAASARRGAALAFVAGAAHFALAMSWIVEPFLVEREVYGWMAPFALGLMAAGGGLFWAAPVWAALTWARGARLVAVVLALAVSDLARGYVLTGFPWALIGHVWIDTPLAQAVAFVGQYGLGLLTLVCVAGAVAGLRRVWGASGGNRFGLGMVPVQMVLGVGVLAAVWGLGMARLAGPGPAASGLVLRLVQPNAAQAAKWDPDLARQHFDRLLAATGAAGAVDLVIWPETALPYQIDTSPEVPGMIAAAARGVPVMLGLQRVVGTRGWNSLRVQDGSGAALASYDKHHLVPFGEYIPFGDLAFDWFGISAFAAQTGRAYSAGPGPQVLDLGALGKVLPLICYEAVFPQDLRTEVRPDWIVQVTNDAWFGTTSGPFQHASLARLRAIEQGLPLARVANTGITQMIDARGRVTAELAFGTAGHLDAALPGPMVAPPYARWGDWPVALLLGGCVLWLFGRRSKPTA